MTERPLYQTHELSKSYAMGEVTVHALREVNVSIARGEFLVLLGPSGSGKSTLLNLLGGMDTPSSGRVVFDGTDISGYTQGELTLYRRRSVGFVFQFFNLVPTLTALENVGLAVEIATEPIPAAEALAAVGLSERAGHFPSQLSGGEQQRVAIARALSKNPQVMLCDEPTGALDYETGKTVLSVLRRVHREGGRTVVVVTHNAAIGRMADRVVSMHSGEVREIEQNENPVEPEDLSW
jgi:putative ABC transport system ATP-binding protein